MRRARARRRASPHERHRPFRLDLGLAALLLVVNGAISLAFGLRLETSLAVAAVRMVVQLAAVGFVLKFVFAQSSPLWTLRSRS